MGPPVWRQIARVSLCALLKYTSTNGPPKLEEKWNKRGLYAEAPPAAPEAADDDDAEALFDELVLPLLVPPIEEEEEEEESNSLSSTSFAPLLTFSGQEGCS